MKGFKNWSVRSDEHGVAWLVLDKHKASVNSLSVDVFVELDALLAEFENDLPTGIVVRSAKSSGFIAGADVTEFTKLESAADATMVLMRAHKIFERLEAMRCPSAALVEGFCLGGGLELALACRYRVAVSKPATRMGFPEVLLGIHPGFGGTMRSIRRTGALAAMDLMLTGRTVDARRAKQLGLVDEAVPEQQAVGAVRKLLVEQPRPHRPAWYLRLLGAAPVRPLIATYLRRKVAQRVRREHYPAPYALIQLWREHGGSEHAMLAGEITSIARLITGDTARNLLRVFFLKERLKGFGQEIQFEPKHVHVVGAGTMGGDIAAWCAYKGLRVSIEDRGPEFVTPMLARAHAFFAKRIHDPLLRQAARERLIVDHNGDNVPSADVVIEAIIEDVGAKQALYRRLEPKLRSGTVLATNTSSICLEALHPALKEPERLVGLHFFNPVAQMQLVEIIGGADTGEIWMQRAAAFTRAIDRLPLPVKSSPGFLVNRILIPYMLEAISLFDEGVSMNGIDQAAKDFGMPMGPIELADRVGLDICLSVGTILAGELSMKVPELLRNKVEQGHLGRKSDRGFYKYRKGKIQLTIKRDGLFSREVVQDRLILKLLNEVASCLRERVVADVDLLDAGMIFGTGFAPFRGGPAHYVSNVGVDLLHRRINELELKCGSRFKADAGWPTVFEPLVPS